jgi:LacI family transcriptional regulator
MSVTLADVAKAAGTSASTVSRALSSPEKVNAGTAERIRNLAEEMGYVPPRAPRQAAGPRIDMLGLIVPDIANPFFPPIIKAVQARAATKDKLAVVTDVEEYAIDEIRHAEFLASHVDGLIIASARGAEQSLRELATLLPLVLINREVEGISSVSVENSVGVVEAVEHFAALGHTTMSYLKGPKRSWSNTQRQKAVREAAERAGLELLEFGPFEPQIQAGAQAADLVLRSGATAVLAYDDLIALGFMARAQERGLRIGDDVSVIGIDDSPMAAMANPPLTTVHVPAAQAGVQAVDLLLDLIEAEHRGETTTPRQRQISVETRLTIRASTGPRKHA